MDKDSLVGLGLLGLPFMCVGVIIGGVVINKIDNKFDLIVCSCRSRCNGCRV